MATVSAVVYEHHKKLDGTWNVKIRIHHKKERKLIDTPHYVTVRQLDEEFRIKDKRLLKLLEEQLDDYRLAIGRLGSKLAFMTAGELRDHLADCDKEVDFIAFCTQHIEQLKLDKRNGTACNHRAVRNSLVDYFKKDSVAITEINSNMLYAYERYLKTERTHIRINQLGKTVKTKEKGMQSGGIYNHMRDLRTLFNAARLFYNNEDLGIFKIKHYPFKRYKIGSPPLTRKRNITVEQVRIVRDCKLPKDSRVEMARDLFMLSFYLCGMNAVDIYQLEKPDPKTERIEYNRSKTAAVRKDNAFISIKIIPEAVPLIKKYVGKLQDKYTTYNGLDTSLSKGLRELRQLSGVPDITFYWARHTFANLARNKCRMTKDDVALALNHVDEGHRTTDIYIDKDWGIVDEVQASVIGLLHDLDEPKVAAMSPSETRKSMFIISA
jgi:integrase